MVRNWKFKVIQVSKVVLKKNVLPISKAVKSLIKNH